MSQSLNQSINSTRISDSRTNCDCEQVHYKDLWLKKKKKHVHESDIGIHHSSLIPSCSRGEATAAIFNREGGCFVPLILAKIGVAIKANDSHALHTRE